MSGGSCLQDLKDMVAENKENQVNNLSSTSYAKQMLHSKLTYVLNHFSWVRIPLKQSGIQKKVLIAQLMI